MALSPQQMKDTASRMYDEANRGNVDIFDELLTEDFVSYGGAGFKDLYGRDAFKELYVDYLKAFPDLTFVVDDLIADDGLCVARGTLSGTHKGDFMGMGPATGNRATWTGIAMLRFNDEGKVDARWQEFDGVGLLQQLGVIPVPGGGSVQKPPAPTPPSHPGPSTSPDETKGIMRR